MSASASASDRLGDSGVEPELKRRRLLDVGGPIEDEETARQKMRDAEVYTSEGDEIVGFDPDNVSDRKQLYSSHNSFIKPMGYFARKGDLPMVRWLYVKGADTRDEDIDFWFPMYAAAQGGKFDACRWLTEHGAAADARRRSSPLRAASMHAYNDLTGLMKWFILKGALCKDDDTGTLNKEVLRIDILDVFVELESLLEWANDRHRCRSAFIIFLQGTLGIPDYSPQKLLSELAKRNRSEREAKIILKNTPTDQCQLLWDSLRDNPVKLLRGKRGILEVISDFIGALHGREALIIRQLTEILPEFVGEEHEVYTSEPSSDSDEYGDY